MNRFLEILVAGTILLVIVGLGRLCDRIRIGHISFGCVWILFIGLVAGQMGIAIDPVFSGAVKDYGLSIFLFEIGLEVGPKLFESRSSNGWLITVLALLVVILGGIVAFIIGKMTDVDIYTLNGIMSGAVSNTPALGAAQMAAATVLGTAPDTIAQGYALAYPMGIIGVFASVLLVLGPPGNAGAAKTNLVLAEEGRNLPGKPSFKHWGMAAHLVLVAAGVLAGRLIGGFSFRIGRLPAPFVLGNAGGTLISAIVVSLLAKGVALPVAADKNEALSRLGLSFFMAAIG